jgi:hypothetical protein
LIVREHFRILKRQSKIKGGFDVGCQNNDEGEASEVAIPTELRVFSEPSCLLPGENRRDFEAIRQMMVNDIRPKTNLEWLWILDLVELSWEILRYRCLKQRVIAAYREIAIESILRRLDGAGMPSGASEKVRLQSRQNAAQWREDPYAAAEIEERLAQEGFDAAAINAEVFLHAREPFAMLDHMLHSAQHRRIVLLREISIRREFARRSEAISNATIEASMARVARIRFRDRRWK